MDEPTAGLDWSMRQQLLNLLAKLKKDWTLLVVTHDAGELLAIADQCWTLNHGLHLATLLYFAAICSMMPEDTPLLPEMADLWQSTLNWQPTNSNTNPAPL